VSGFDAAFIFRPDDEALIRAFFAAGRRRARRLDVRWRSEIKPAFGYVALDGASFNLDMLMERLRRELPAVAEGVPSESRTPQGRRHLANGVVEIISRFRGSMYDRYCRNGEVYVPRLRALRRQAVGLVLYDLFPRRHEDLWPRLSITLDVLSSWVLDEIAAEVALEELHTAFELLLTRAAGRQRAPMFYQLVELADQQGWLLGYGAECTGETSADPMPAMYWANPSDALTPHDLLISLKDQRKVSKHRGAVGAEPWLSLHFTAAAALLERLSSRMP
jgi:hypothetical protein